MKIGVPELLIVLVIVLVLFGPKQLPKLSKIIGQSIRSFKEGAEKSMEDDEEEVKPEKKAAKSEEPAAEKAEE